MGTEAREGEGEEVEVEMPRTMRGRLAFSYTSLHSAVERFVHAHAKEGELDERTKLALARSFQSAAVGQLEEKVVLGMRKCAQEGIAVRSLVVSGGVASNQYLRERYVVAQTARFERLMDLRRLRACLDQESPDEKISLVFPPPSLCTGRPYQHSLFEAEVADFPLYRQRCDDRVGIDAPVHGWGHGRLHDRDKAEMESGGFGARRGGTVSGVVWVGVKVLQ